MFFTKGLLLLCLALFQISAFADALVGDKILIQYMNEIESALDAGNLSPNQIKQLNISANRKSVLWLVRFKPDLLVRRFLGIYANNKLHALELIAQNEQVILKGLDASIASAHQKFSYYRLYLGLNHNLPRTTQLLDQRMVAQLGQKEWQIMYKTGEQVQNSHVERFINSYRKAEGKPVFRQELLLSEAAYDINAINMQNSRKGAQRLSAYLGKSFIKALKTTHRIF